MTSEVFIFSNERKDRLLRHFVFWLGLCFYLLIFKWYIYDIKYLGYTSTYVIRVLNMLMFLPFSFFYAYFSLYILLPYYILPGKYFRLFVIVAVISSCLFFISYWIGTMYSIHLYWDMPLSRAPLIRRLDFSISNGIIYPFTAGGFAVGIKMAKNFYQQRKQNQRLAKQKIDAEVLLLKSQVHPRFLFHSLNSIYGEMLKGSDQSSAMLLKLSDLLSYILYESDDYAVPLEKELLLLENFIDLEQVSWGDRLLFTLRRDPAERTTWIAPLVLLPVVEYVFEESHNTENRQLLLQLDILTTINTCRFFFTIGGDARPPDASCIEHPQLLQVQKRLQVLYPGRHHYAAEINRDSITISLSVEQDK